MALFDPKAYEEQVVKPLRGRAGRLPDDLVARYAIDLTMSDAELVAWLGQLRSHWHKSSISAAKPMPIRSLYKAFLREDEELGRQYQAAMSTMAWWQAHQAKRAGARDGEVRALADLLRLNFGDLGLITPGQLEATVRASAPELAPTDVAAALTRAGVEVTAPVDLPKASGMQDTLYRKLKSLLTDAAVLSVPELLHGKLGKFWLLTSFRAEPNPAGGLTFAAVEAATRREDRRSGNQAAKEAIGLVGKAARDGVDLRLLSLYHLLDTVREHRQQGAPASALLVALAQVGLDRSEAAKAVVSVLSENLGAPAGGLAKITALLEEGQLLAAQQALPTVASAEDATAARQLVERHAAQVSAHRKAGHDALRAGDEVEALNHLRQAAALAVDDEEIAAELRRIPLPPVIDLQLAPEGTGVRASWRVPASHQQGTKYRLVRKDDRVPADPGDGTAVVEDTATVALDAKTPAARRVGYAVFASPDGAAWSRAASATIEVLPPVRNVRLTTEPGAVRGSWQVHHEATSVEVSRTDSTAPSGAAGQSVATSGKTSFRDHGVVADGEYAYRLTAHYRRPDGSAAASASVAVLTTGHRTTQPVAALRLRPAESEHGPAVAITWRQPADCEVVIRRAGQPGEWEFGQTISLADLRDFGEQVVGRLEVDGDWRTLTATVPTGRFCYVPFTVGADGAVRGQDAALGIALPVSSLHFQRIGDEVLLSWVWPERSGTAEVRWQGSVANGRLRLTRQQYVASGGARIRCGEGEIRARVHSVVHAEGGECESAAVEVTVPGRLPAVNYTVELALRPLQRGGSATVRLSAESSVPRCTVSVVLAPGRVMPRRVSDGQVLLRSVQDLTPGIDEELRVELPKVRRPYWVRCFVDDADPVRLVDPPAQQLKVM
jgi:hypothetical protein